MKRAVPVFCAVSVLFTSGCTSEQLQEYFEGDYLHVGDATLDSTASPYGNKTDYLLGEYDIKEVDPDQLDEIPAYDFTGPSNYTDGLNSGSIQTSNQTATTKESYSDRRVMIFPMYSGHSYSWYMPANATSYKLIEKDVKKSKMGYSEFLKKNADLAYVNGLGGSFVRANDTGAVTFDYKEQKASEFACQWNICLELGSRLENEGYSVDYPMRASIYKDLGESASSHCGSAVEKSAWTTWANSVVKEDPYAVVIVGLNRAGLGPAKGAAGTHIAYVGGFSQMFADTIVSSWDNSKVLKKQAPLAEDSACYEADGKSDNASCNAAAMSLYALEAAGYSGYSICTLLSPTDERMDVADYKKSNEDFIDNYKKIAAALGKSVAYFLKESN